MLGTGSRHRKITVKSGLARPKRRLKALHHLFLEYAIRQHEGTTTVWSNMPQLFTVVHCTRCVLLHRADSNRIQSHSIPCTHRFPVRVWGHPQAVVWNLGSDPLRGGDPVLDGWGSGGCKPSGPPYDLATCRLIDSVTIRLWGSGQPP